MGEEEGLEGGELPFQFLTNVHQPIVLQIQDREGVETSHTPWDAVDGVVVQIQVL